MNASARSRAADRHDRGRRVGTAADAGLSARGIELEQIECPACQDSRADLLFTGRDRLHDLPGRFNVVRCRTCSLIRTNPRPTASSIGSYYPEDYSPYVETAKTRDGWWRRAVRALVDPLDVAVPPLAPGRLLEIGTASGAYALEMIRRGWTVTGIELDPGAARTAAERTGCRILCGDVLTMSMEEDQYDLICAWMAFEHVANPVELLERCYGWLRPGGSLAFSVPDCGSWQFRYFRDAWFATQVPTHLFHFTFPVLRRLLEGAGYDRIEARWQRTFYDVLMSSAYVLEDRYGARVGRHARGAVNSVAGRALSRGLGVVAAPWKLTGRITVWARKPPDA